MRTFIGRPPDPSNQDFICPKCHNQSLRKAGFHVYFKQGKAHRQQLYNCKMCHFTTIKPLGDGDGK